MRKYHYAHFNHVMAHKLTLSVHRLRVQTIQSIHPVRATGSNVKEQVIEKLEEIRRINRYQHELGQKSDKR
jgi:hypothetical protein